MSKVRGVNNPEMPGGIRTDELKITAAAVDKANPAGTCTRLLFHRNLNPNHRPQQIKIRITTPQDLSLPWGPIRLICQRRKDDFL
jgi:hypothetical protein